MAGEIEKRAVERLDSESASPILPAHFFEKEAHVAQLVERVLGKDEVMGSNPISSSAVLWLDDL